MRSLTFSPTLVLLVCGAAAMLPAGARAQNALGNGDALDANHRVGSGGRNARTRNLQETVRFNNAVVTGNAAFGRSFRGDVGYLASNEFRASMASDDLYTFNRDTMASSGGIRGTEALQYQFALATGQSDDTLSDFTRFTVDRDTGGAASGWSLAGLRSTGDFTTNSPLRPMLMGLKNDKGEIKSVTASPLLGVTLMPQLSDEGERPQEQADAALPLPAGATVTPTETQIFDPAKGGNESAGPTAVNSKAPVMTAAHRRILTQVSQSLGASPDEPVAAVPNGGDMPEWMKQLEALRRQLRGESDGQPLPAPAPPTDAPIPDDPATPEDESKAAEPADIKPEVEKAPEAAEPSALSEEVLNALNVPLVIDSYVLQDDASMARYSEHMRSGQEAIAKGRFFDAEERFVRALATVPGDVTADAGRIHAQIGAGLYTSAAANLRSLLTEHPEMAGVKYDSVLLPPAPRLERAVELIGEQCKEADASLGSDGPLLLAYVGYQSGNDVLMRDELARLADRTNANDASGQALLKLLEGVWLK